MDGRSTAALPRACEPVCNIVPVSAEELRGIFSDEVAEELATLPSDWQLDDIASLTPAALKSEGGDEL